MLIFPGTDYLCAMCVHDNRIEINIIEYIPCSWLIEIDCGNQE